MDVGARQAVTRDEKLKRIAVLWAENLSTSTIAKRLGIPKNTVCGAILRARLRDDPRFPVRKPGTIRKDPGSGEPEPAPIIVEVAPKRKGPLRILELKADDCKFAVRSGEGFGDHWFCAELRAPDSPYCEQHHQEAHSTSN